MVVEVQMVMAMVAMVMMLIRVSTLLASLRALGMRGVSCRVAECDVMPSTT